MTTARRPAIGMLLAHEQLDDAGRRARRQHRAALHEPADILRMKAVDVLGRIDGVEDLLLRRLAKRVRQRRLHEDAVARVDRR